MAALNTNATGEAIKSQLREWSSETDTVCNEIDRLKGAITVGEVEGGIVLTEANITKLTQRVATLQAKILVACTKFNIDPVYVEEVVAPPVEQPPA